MDAEEVAPVDEATPEDAGFIRASEDSEWYQNLNREGSCLRLFKLLKKDAQLVRHMGADDVTVLHKGVRHGCVQLVKYILADMFDEENRQRLGIRLTREDLLRKTTSDGVTPVAIAIMSGSPKMMILLRWAIDLISPETIKQVTKQMPAVRTWSVLARKDAFTEKDVRKLDYYDGKYSEDETSSATPSAQSEDDAAAQNRLKDDGAEIRENMSVMADEQSDNQSWSKLGEISSVMAVNLEYQSDDDGPQLGKNNELLFAQTSGDNINIVGSMRLNEVADFVPVVWPNELKVNKWLDSLTAPNVN